MASTAASTPGPGSAQSAPVQARTYQPTVPQIKAAEVPSRLQKGDEFIKWDESSGVGTPVILRIDENGFFLYWTDQTTKEILEALDISLIRDARTGKYAKIPKDHKIRGKVESGIKEVESSKLDTPDKYESKQFDKSLSGLSEATVVGKGDLEDEKVEDKIPSLCLEDCTVTICHGTDFVNLSFINFYTTKKESAQLWTDVITKLVFSLSLLNSSAMRFLMKLHTKLCLQVDKTGNIPIKSIVKMFAQNKEDKKRVEEALQSIYGPDITKEKTSVLNPAQFTFEDHFYPFYKKLVQRTEVQKIYDSLCDPTTRMIGVQEFKQFLNGTQRDPRLNEILYPYAKLHNVQTLIEQYEKNKENVSKHQLSFDGFLRYLMSDDNPIVASSKLEVCNAESMEHPLAHYFINSSHNTYLTGHQIYGKSSVEIYRQCLLAGCRCVELDFWKSKTKTKDQDEPCITHGHTLVPEVSAREVIEAIAESAFKTSEYPVILSFENHCNRKEQSKIAEYCREIFGEMLLDAPLDSHSLKGDSLPPPSLLKRKIIIKNKKKKKGETSSGSSDAETSPVGETAPGSGDKALTIVPVDFVATPSEASQQEGAPTPVNEMVSEVSEDVNSECVEKDYIPVETNAEQEVVNEAIAVDLEGSEAQESLKEIGDVEEADEISISESAPPDRGGSYCITSLKSRNGDDVAESGSDGEGGKPDEDKTSKTIESEAGEEISALVNYVQPVRFVSFEKALEKKRFYEMSSFDENQAKSLLKEYPIEFVNYNKRQLSRVYPAGTKINSANFNPQLFWNAGCQLVALNYQTLDLGMQLNLGMFEYNQRCGYLLKPEFMRIDMKRNEEIDIFAEKPLDGIVAGTLKIYVLSGQFLSDKRINTYVEVHLFGLPNDTKTKDSKFRTRVVPNNGINPVYSKDEEKEKPFDCNVVIMPELASVYIAAYEESGMIGKFIGHRVLPLIGLCPGYRHVTLRNEAGQPLLATLFLQIEVNDFVPDKFDELAEALSNPTEYQKKNKLAKNSSMLAGLETGDTGPCSIDTQDKMDSDAFSAGGPKSRHCAPIGNGSKILCDRSMSDADESVPGIAPPKLTKGAQGSFAGLLGQAGVAASSAAAGAAAGASAAASITAKRHSIAPTSDKGVVVRSTSGEISSLQEQVKKELTVDTLEELMKSKAVREKRLEMDKKLEALRKKHEKDRNRILVTRGSQDAEKSKSKFYMSNRLVKRLSRQNISSGVQEVSTPHDGNDTESEIGLSERSLREQLQLERDLQKKYHEMVFSSISKTIESSQATQLKTLKALQDRDTAEMMRKLEADRRKEMKELVKKHKDREEVDRKKRELAENAVDRGVNERKRLEDMYEKKKKELEEKYSSVWSSLEMEKKRVDDSLQKEFDERLTTMLKRDVQIREIQIASTSESHDVQ